MRDDMGYDWRGETPPWSGVLTKKHPHAGVHVILMGMEEIGAFGKPFPKYEVQDGSGRSVFVMRPDQIKGD